MSVDPSVWAGPTKPPSTFEQLADEHAVCRLAKIYAIGMDLRDYALARSAFAPNAINVGANGPEPIDESLPKTYAIAQSFHATQHVISNQYVQIDGDSATVWSYGVAHHKVVPGEERDELIAGVHYRDECRRDPQGWLIAERTIVLQWMDMGRHPGR